MKFKITILFTSLFLISATLTNAVLAYTQVLGKQDAPGLIKKQVDVNIGRVESVKDDKIEIMGRGKKTQLQTGPQTSVIKKPQNLKISPGQIKKNDLVASIESTPGAQSTRGAKQLLLVRESTEGAKPETRRRAVYGLVREINGNILVISHPIKDNPRNRVEVVTSTVIKIKGFASPSIGDIKVGDRVAAVGQWAGDNLVAKKVHVIPGKTIGLLERIATQSATPSASPTGSATPSATPIASPSQSPFSSP